MQTSNNTPAQLPIAGGIACILYSGFSPLCTALWKEVAGFEALMQFFSIICIDNEEIRTIIKNSDLIQIEYVPCIIHIQQGGSIDTYQGHRAIDWMKQYLNTVAAANTQRTPGGMPISSLQDLGLDDAPTGDSMDKLRETMSDIQPLSDDEKEAQLTGAQAKMYEPLRMKEHHPDLTSRSHRNPFEAMREQVVLNPAYEEEQIIDHTTQQQMVPPPPTKTIIQDLTLYEDDDIDPMINDDPSGMNAPREEEIKIVGAKQPIRQPPQNDRQSRAAARQDPSGMNVAGGRVQGGQQYHRNKKSQAIKDRAAELGEVREKQEAVHSRTKQDALQPQRRAALRK